MKEYMRRFFLLMALTGWLFGQEINLDRPTDCGPLKCYPLYDDPHTYYYLPANPRLAYKDGKPQFSFLKYARLKEHEKAGISETAGGGIVHFLVTYGATPQEVMAAREALRAKDPEAKLEGPIVYRRGHFALVTSFKKGNEEFVKAVAVGKAPLIEGQKAAVSIHLTKEGAELLWEEFKTSTPDISLVFEMEFAGLRQPYKATVRGDWSRIAKSHRLKAGFKYAWFGADVAMLFQELRQNGAVIIETKGEDKNMDKIVESANAMLLKMMFEPAPPDELTRAEAEKEDYSNLDRALKLLKEIKELKGKKSSYLAPPGYGPNFLRPLPAIKTADFSLVTPAFAEDPGDAFYYEGLEEDFYDLVHKCTDVGLMQSIDVAQFSLDEIRYCQKLSSKLMNHLPALPPDYQAIVNESFIVYHVQIPRIFKEYYGVSMPEAETLASQGGSLFSKVAKAIGKTMDRLTQKAHSVAASLASGQKKRSHRKKRHTHHKKRKPDPKKVAAEELAYVNQHCAVNAGEICDYLLRQSKEQVEKCQEKLLSLTDKFEILTEEERQRVEALEDLYTAKLHECRENPNRPPSSHAAAFFEGAKECFERSRANRFPEKYTQECLKIVQNALTMGKDYPAWKKERLKSWERVLKRHLKNKPSATGEGATPTASGGAGQPSPRRTAAEGNTTRPTGGGAAVPAAGSDEQNASKKGGGDSSLLKKLAKAFKKPHAISLVASYRLKNIRRSGHFEMTLARWRTEMQANPMSENIGDLYARWGHDPSVFRAVLIDDPVFKQRDIFVTLDGQDSATFSKHVNFVTVRLRKRHQNGRLTTDEVVITPELFNEKGNHFVLRYGWKGDRDRERWLQYEYRITWSFHGGVKIDSGWRKNATAMLSLTPPFHYRTISIEGEGETLDKARVRHAVIEFSSSLGGKTLKTRVTIKNRGTAPSAIVDIPESPGGRTTAVITWYLKGGKKIVSKPIPVQGDILYWDELEVQS